MVVKIDRCIEIVAEDGKVTSLAAKICYRCWEKGVILIFFANSVLRIQPPLVITREQMDRAIDVIERAINEYLAGDIPDKVL